MSRAGTPQWSLLERWSPTLFLVSGGILVVYATFNGLWAFTNVMPEGHGLEIGYVLGFLGLLGLYPSLARRSPWLARLGAFAAGIGVFASIYVSMNDYVQVAGLMAGNLPGWPYLRLLPLVGFLVGYLSSGIAALRSDAHSQTVGLLLLIPGIIVILMLGSIFTGHPLLSRFQTVFVVSAGEAMAHLAIGATLRTGSPPADIKESSTDSDQQVIADE